MNLHQANYRKDRKKFVKVPIELTTSGNVVKARFKGVANCVFGATTKEAIDRLRSTDWCRPEMNQHVKDKVERQVGYQRGQ